jgi:hypothetical protein
MNLTLNVIRLIGFEPQADGSYRLRAEEGPLSHLFFLTPMQSAPDGALICQFRCRSADAEEWTTVSKVEDLIFHAYTDGYMAAAGQTASYGIIQQPVNQTPDRERPCAGEAWQWPE